jgi:hypothetical protein
LIAVTKRLKITTPGVEVMVGARRYQISQVLDLEQVLVRDLQSGDIRQIPFSDLRPLSLDEVQKTAASEHDAQQLSDAHWAIAQHRLAVIRPLLEREIIMGFTMCKHGPKQAAIAPRRSTAGCSTISTVVCCRPWYPVRAVRHPANAG